MTKRIISVLLSILMILSSMSLPAFAVTEPAISFGDAVISGDQVKVPVKLNALPDTWTNLSAFTMEYTYSSDKLVYTDTESAALTIADGHKADGKVYWLDGASTVTDVNDTVLFYLVFKKAAGAAGEASVSVDFCEIAAVGSSQVLADAETTISLDPASQVSMGNAAINGREVKIPVVLDKLPADIDNIAAATVEYTYDSAVLTYKGSEADLLDVATTTEAGKAYWTAATGAAVTGENVTLFTLIFEAAEGLTNKETEVKITFAELGSDTPNVSKKVTIGNSAKLNLTTVSVADAVVSMGSAAINDREVTIPVVLDKLPADIENIAAVTVEYTYDDKVLTYKGTEAGLVDASGTSEAGKVLYAASTGAAVAGSNVTLVTLVFEAAEGLTSKETEVKIDFAELGDDTPNDSKKVTIGDSAKLTITTVSVPDAVVSMGNAAINDREVKIPVVLDKLPADISNIAAATIEYTYDSAVLTYKGSAAGILDVAASTEAGKAYWTSATGVGVTGENVTLFTLIFEAAEGLTNKETEVKITFAELGDDAPNKSEKVTIGGSAKLTITTEAPGPGEPELNGIEVTPETLKIPLANQTDEAAIKAFVEDSITVTGKYSDNVDREVTTGYTVEISADGLKATITYQGMTDEVTLTKEVKELGAIRVTPGTLDILPDDQESVDSVKAVVEKAIADGDIKIEATYTNSADVDEITSGHTVTVSADKETATVTYDGKTAEIDLNLIAKELKGITAAPAALEIAIADQESADTVKAAVEKAIADGSIKLTATYTNSADVDEITTGYTVAISADGTKATVTYDGKTADIALTYEQKILSGITVEPKSLNVPLTEQGDIAAFVKVNATVTASYENAADEVIDSADYEVAVSDDKTKATITYGDKTAEVALTLDTEAKAVTSITVAPEEITVPYANQGSADDIKAYVEGAIEAVTATYEDGSSYKVASYEVSISEDATAATVTYEGVSAEIALTMEPAPVVAESIETNTKKVTIDYDIWSDMTADEIAKYIRKLTNFRIYANMSDGTQKDITDVADIEVDIDDKVATISYEGYEIELPLNLKSKPSSGGISGGNGSYGYKDIIIPIVPGDIVTPDDGMFYDIEPAHYAYEAIKTLRERGFISGDGTNKVYPNMGITREETAKVAIAINNIDVEKGLPIDFTDADQVSAWAVDYVGTAIDKGIMIGYNDRTLRPRNTVTRGEMVAIIIRSLGIETNDTATGFSDVPAELWSAKYISAAAQLGFVNGYEDGTFRPDQYITRAEAFVIYYRALQFRDALTAAAIG